MSRFIYILLLSAGISVQLFSQGIRGEIRDVNGEPVPYAAIFIKELTRGTTCNALGLFSLPLPEGNYTIFFRSMGYTEVARNITVGPDYSDIIIQLPPQTYMIPEVRISASGEDPAYWIMRKTIGLANYHLNEVSNYNSEIYIKGSAILDKLPKVIAKRIEANDFEIKEDEAYMLESLNEVSFEAPDNYTLRVISSQNTLPGYVDNVNPMDYVNASLYQQEIEGVISPLARTAFNYYRFEFEGTFLVGTHIVNKIKVTPKRKSQQLVEGYLFVVEDLWCLHSSDLSLNTIAGRVSLQQLYANVIMDAWLPVSHKIRVDIDIVGVLGSATYISSLKYSDVILNPNLPETYFSSTIRSKETDVPEEEKPVSKEQEKINELLQKEELSNREVVKLSKLIEKETEKAEEGSIEEDLNLSSTSITVAEDAVKNDSLYWNRVRPIPLTPEEHLTLKNRDSIIGVQAVNAPKDTIKVSGRKKVTFKNLVYGRTYIRNRGKFRFTHDGLVDIEKFGYNTVDGLYYGQEISIDWRPDTLYTVRSNLNASYAFHRNAPLVYWNSDLLYAGMARGKVALYLNYTSSDFNGQNGIPNPTNLFYTVLMRQNYLKLYEQIDATLYNRIDPFHGMVLTTYATYGVQNKLENNSLFSFFYRKEPFTDNTPGGRAATAPELLDHKKFVAHVELEYTPKRYYVIRNHRKNFRDSKWPTFSIAYRKAIPAEANGWSDYSMTEAKIRHSFDVGLLSQIDWSLAAGAFTDTTSIYFSDYKHFKSNPLYIDMADLDEALMFSDYYKASTQRYWVNLQTTLSSSYLLIKYLPWFSERLWKEALDLAYLHTPGTPNYFQLGYRLEDIFFMIDMGVYVGFREKIETPGEWAYQGVTFRLNLNF
ncbi:MAG: carboxypeptidase-like regulatory domain-containing protein [Bacteroidetes bacterium]|nr:carboxypeptidase-like regulatory domain-containing protein [Bacteroidota bacterium]